MFCVGGGGLADIQNVLITGGAGFLGSHLVEACVQRDFRVTVVDSLQSGTLGNLESVLVDITFIGMSVLDALQQKGVDVDDFDCVFHLAANAYVPPSVECPEFDFHHNLETTFALLECLRRSKTRPRFVFASSAAVYGNPVSMPIRECDPTIPIAPYGVSKLAAERYAAVYSQLYGVPAVSLRLFSVFGPRQRKQVVYDLFRKLDADPRKLTVLGDGTQERDFSYVADTVDAMLLAAEHTSMQGGVYNVGSGTSITVRELVQAICKIAGATPEIEFTGDIRAGDPERWAVDMSRLQGLGYKPRIGWYEGLERTYGWYQACESLSDE